MKRTISIIIDSENLDQIEEMAGRYGLTRSQFIRNLIEYGFDHARFLEGVGVLSVVHRGSNIFEKFKSALKNGSFNIKGKTASFPME